MTSGEYTTKLFANTLVVLWNKTFSTLINVQVK